MQSINEGGRVTEFKLKMNASYANFFCLLKSYDTGMRNRQNQVSASFRSWANILDCLIIFIYRSLSSID